MHGLVHDFVVAKTVKEGHVYPSGFGGGYVGDFIPKEVASPKRPGKFPLVLDIGSLDICGNMRDYNFCEKGPKWIDLISCERYIGIDLMAGRNVDMVMDAHNLDFKSNHFDLVLCTSVLEHDADPKKTVEEAIRVTKKGGMFLFTTHDDQFPDHRQLGGAETELYNKFSYQDFQNLFDSSDSRTKTYHVGTDLLAEGVKL